MANLSYDVWGALVVAPPLIFIGLLGVRRMFSNELQPMQRIVMAGLLAKMSGGLVRYWVAFDAYGGATDAQRYHEFASSVSGKVWAGEIHAPSSQGTLHATKKPGQPIHRGASNPKRATPNAASTTRHHPTVATGRTASLAAIRTP